MSDKTVQTMKRDISSKDVRLQIAENEKAIRELEERIKLLKELDYKKNRQRSSTLLAMWAGITAIATYVVTARDHLVGESLTALVAISVVLTGVTVRIVVDFLFSQHKHTKKKDSNYTE